LTASTTIRNAIVVTGKLNRGGLGKPTRDDRAYPQRSVRKEQQRWPAKDSRDAVSKSGDGFADALLGFVRTKRAKHIKRESRVMKKAAKPTQKEVTLKTLTALKAKLYARSAITMQAYPEKAKQIQARVDADASKIAFAINLVSAKM
jgi:hypothetical protein